MYVCVILFVIVSTYCRNIHHILVKKIEENFRKRFFVMYDREFLNISDLRTYHSSRVQETIFLSS